MNTRRNGIAVIHCLYCRNKTGRICGGHVRVYAAYCTYRAVLRAANTKRSRDCDYVCHCATSFLVEFIYFFDFRLVRSCKSSEVPGASAVQSFHSACRVVRKVCTLGRCAFGRPCPDAPSPFHAMRRVKRCCDGTGTAWCYG